MEGPAKIEASIVRRRLPTLCQRKKKRFHNLQSHNRQGNAGGRDTKRNDSNRPAFFPCMARLEAAMFMLEQAWRRQGLQGQTVLWRCCGIVVVMCGIDGNVMESSWSRHLPLRFHPDQLEKADKQSWAPSPYPSLACLTSNRFDVYEVPCRILARL